MFRPVGRKTICVDLRIIFLIHVAIFDPLFSILDPYPSPLSPQQSLLSTEAALLPATSCSLQAGFASSFTARPVEYSHGRGVSVAPVTLFHGENHFLPDCVIQDSTQCFNYLWLGF